jgi:uncharacterized protein (UPF0276 family)
MSKRLGYANLGLGVGLRHPHFPYLMENADWGIDWFEIISENYMDNYGYARMVLDKIREKVPIVMHGVSLNIGNADPLNYDYLQKLKTLAAELQPEWVSDHLCWTGIQGFNSHDLLPMPMNQASLQHVTERVLRVQDFLQRPLILENPSTYLEFNSSDIPEWTFLTELCKNTDCGLLLDVNNVVVSAYNHGYNPFTYIENLPHDHIVQVHLAGHSQCGKIKIDTHDRAVPFAVWKVYKALIDWIGEPVATLLEWDANIPDFPELVQEVSKAKRALKADFRVDFRDTMQEDSLETVLSTPIVNAIG